MEREKDKHVEKNVRLIVIGEIKRTDKDKIS